MLSLGQIIKVETKGGFPLSCNFYVQHIGVRAGGAREAAAIPNFGQLRFLGSKRKFGQSQVLKTFPCLLLFYYYYCPISSSICKLPIRSEIYNCTFKNTNKVSIIIIIKRKIFSILI